MTSTRQPGAAGDAKQCLIGTASMAEPGITDTLPHSRSESVVPDKPGGHAEQNDWPTRESGDTDMRRPEPDAAAAGSTAAKLVRALIPMTPGLILRVLLSAFLFFCGIVFGVWLIIRFRRLDRGNGSPDAPRLRSGWRGRA
jgi:hypothetical protein